MMRTTLHGWFNRQNARTEIAIPHDGNVHSNEEMKDMDDEPGLKQAIMYLQ